MAQGMKENFTIIYLMAEESLFMQMEISMKGNGMKDKQKDLELFIINWMESMKESGKKMYSMDMVNKNGQMDQDMKVIM